MLIKCSFQKFLIVPIACADAESVDLFV